MCGLLVVGFLCNFAMRAVDEKYFHRAPAPGNAPRGSTPA
jgi:hypothetical protein